MASAVLFPRGWQEFSVGAYRQEIRRINNEDTNDSQNDVSRRNHNFVQLSNRLRD